MASPTPTLTANPTPTPQPELKRVKKKAISAKASSTLPPEGSFSYEVENTLDRDPDTAWNSNGEDVGAFARVTLTYRFDDPVELRALEIYNGYQLSDESFFNNSRVKRVLVSTDATKQSFELLDKQGKQTLAFDFGQTKRVVLTVEAVYRTPRPRRSTRTARSLTSPSSESNSVLILRCGAAPTSALSLPMRPDQGLSQAGSDPRRPDASTPVPPPERWWGSWI